MKTYCINLRERTDRWRQAQKEAAKLGIELTRFNAIKRDVGHDGCKASHMRLLKEASGWRSGTLRILDRTTKIFMITEDDMKVMAKDAIWVFRKARQQLPYDWDMLYLGATLTKHIERYSDNLFVLKGGSASQAIIYNNQNGVVDYILKNHNRNRFSALLRDDVQGQFNCFVTYPMVTTQRSGYSDLMNKWVSGRRILRAYKKYTKENYKVSCLE